MTANEQVFRMQKTPLQLLSDDLVNQTRDLLERLVELRETRKISISEVADAMGLSEDDVREFEGYAADPHLDDIVSYALAVKARISIEVSDGEAWAKRALSPDQSELISSWVNAHSTATSVTDYTNPRVAFQYV